VRRTASQDQRLGAHLIRAPSGHGCGSAWGGGSAPGAIGCSTGPLSTGASPARCDDPAAAALARSVARTISVRAALAQAPQLGAVSTHNSGRLRPPFLLARRRGIGACCSAPGQPTLDEPRGAPSPLGSNERDFSPASAGFFHSAGDLPSPERCSLSQTADGSRSLRACGLFCDACSTALVGELSGVQRITAQLQEAAGP